MNKIDMKYKRNLQTHDVSLYRIEEYKVELLYVQIFQGKKSNQRCQYLWLLTKFLLTAYKVFSEISIQNKCKLSRFTEGERTEDVKGEHLLLEVVTFMSLTLTR